MIKLIFDSSPKSKEIIDFDPASQKKRIKNTVIDIQWQWILKDVSDSNQNKKIVV